MMKLTKSYKIVFGIGIAILVVILAVILLSDSKITDKSYTILDKGYIEVSVNKNIGKMSNLEYLLDDLLENYSFYNCVISDDEVCISLISSPQILSVVGVYENIGTAQNSKRAELINSKTRELNQYLKKYLQNKN